MAGVTDEGWVTKSLDTLVDELADSAEEEFGESFPTTPDSVFGQFANVFGASCKDLWDLAQAIVDTQNRDTAEGVYLNYLAALIGLTRLEDSGSTGDIIFTGSVGTTVASGTVCQDTLSRNVTTDEAASLSRASCYQSTFSVKTVADGTDYTITVEGDSYVFTSGSSATEEGILEGIADVLDEGDGFTVENVDSTIIITLDAKTNTLTTTNTSNLKLESVGTRVASTASTTGDLTFEAESITTLVTTNIGIDSVINLEDFENGRDEETDTELRLRMDEQESSTGTATIPSIESSLTDVDGVTKVLIVENNTMSDLDSGQTAKTFQCFVTGGSDDDIGKVIWETKPAGISSYGTETVVVEDDNGDEQTVYFSRKTDLYAWAIITYALEDDGNDFPSEGETLLQDAVVTYGEQLDDGEDYSPTRMYQYLYTVDGCYITDVSIATTSSESDTPTYQSTKISIDDTEYLNFDTSRVTVTS